MNVLTVHGLYPRMLDVLLASDEPRTSWSFQLLSDSACTAIHSMCCLPLWRLRKGVHSRATTFLQVPFLSDEFLSPTYTLLWIEVVLLNKTMLVANSSFFRLWLLFFDPNVECPKVSEENWMSREYRLFQDLGTSGGGLDENRLKRWLKGVIRCAGWI